MSEAKARLLEDLKLLLDERLLCRVQKRALFSLSLSKGPSYRHAEPAADLPWAHPAGLPETDEDGVVKLAPPALHSSSDRCARRCCGTRRLCRRRPRGLAISTFNVRPSISWPSNFLTGNSGSERQTGTRPGFALVTRSRV